MSMEGRVRTGRGIAALAAAIAAIAAAPAHAATEPSGAKAKAIEKAFLAKQDDDVRILKIRVSTEDRDFAAVFYEVAVDPPPARAATARGLGTPYRPPPVLLKQGKGGKWKTVGKAPAKVLKDLKVKRRKSAIEISGEVTASLTQPASCTDSGDFYSASIYDKDMDLYLSIQIFEYAGHGWYPARSVGSVAGLYSDAGTVLRFETGLAHDAFQSTGDILAKSGWGFIGAGMARTPPEEGTESNTVTVSGVWECR
jgi:hypothetical protein